MDRTVLPIPDEPYAGPVYEDAKDPRAVFEPIRPVRPPEGAPNVLVILLDDVGFGAASAFGGPCRTPTAERLAGNGLSFSRFHTTALCAPTRQALLTGRNHHAVGMGAITEIATSTPGLHLGPAAVGGTPGGGAAPQRVRDRAVREVPRGADVADQPGRARSTRGPRAGAASSTSSASSVARPTSTPPPCTAARPRSSTDATADEGYHFTEDMTDRAIAWVRQQSALTPDKPFFMYFAPGRDARPAPRAAGVGGQVPRRVRRRLGRAAGADLRRAEAPRRRARRRRADRPS